MNVERLRAVQVEEREADSLRALPDSFYREAAAYIEDLRAERARAAERAQDPFGSEEVRRLTDEIETAEEVAEAIYERRVGKLVKRASLAAAGMPADEEGLTSEEAELFADLVAQIEAHREEVLETFDGDRAAARGDAEEGSAGLADETADAADDGGGSAPTLDAGDAVGGGDGSAPGSDSPGSNANPDRDAPPPPPDEPAPEEGQPPDGSSPDDDPTDPDSGDDVGDDPGAATDGDVEAEDAERVTLRITRDVGEVFGVDERVYDLASEDVVTLPAANAKPLLDRDAAEQID